MKNFLKFAGIFILVFTGIAVLTTPIAEAAAKQIYYSAGQNISDHKTGSPTVTLSSGVATFSVAQTAPNIGVGDRVTYNSTQKVFISGKISQTKWTVVTVKGDTPSNVSNATVNSIRHEFDSLNNAVSYYTGFQAGDANHLNTSNLISGNYILNIPLYYDTGPEYFTGGGIYAGILISGSSIVTGPNNYIRIYTPTNTASEVNLSQRHDGKWNNQKYSLIFSPDNNSTAAIRTYKPYVKIDGLQIKIISTYNGNKGIEASYISSGWVEVSNNIITGQILNYASGISMGYNIGNLTGKIWNNLIYDLRGTNYGSSKGIKFGECYNQDPCSTGTGYIYNNTIINVQGGINNESTLGLIVAKNNIVQDSNWGYGGTFSASSNNISNNGAPGSNSQNNTTVSFVNKTGKDFHLSPSDTKALNRGVSLISDPYLPVSSDIEGDSRPSGVAWDIGADEIYVAPKGDISVRATLDGQPWPSSGTSAINYSLSGPSGNISNSTVPNTYSNVAADETYTLNYVSGGPAGAALDSVTPIGSQFLPKDDSIGFTLNFKTIPPQCSDGVDNDSDGKCDFSGCGVLPADPGCSSLLDNDELPQQICGNGAIDLGEDCDGTNLGGATCQSLGFTGGTLGCTSPPNGCLYDITQCVAAPNPDCLDGEDNDGDGQTDYPNDIGCVSENDNNETNQCVDGLDNDGDGKIDNADPGCHTDGNPANGSSYSAEGNRESNQLFIEI